MERLLTDSRIQFQPAKLFSRSGAAASISSSASMAAFLASIVPYTRPSTLARRYSKTRSAGFSSGEYGGCSSNGTVTSAYAGPRWPGARSQTTTDTPSSPHCLTIGAMDTAFIFSVQPQRTWPLTPFTTRFRYAHVRWYSSACTTLTPRGAHTRRTWPIKPTRISSPQYRPSLSVQPMAVSWALSPPFSKPPALPQKPWDSVAEGLSSSSPGAQTRGAYPNRCTSRRIVLHPLYSIPYGPYLAFLGQRFQFALLMGR